MKYPQLGLTLSQDLVAGCTGGDARGPMGPFWCSKSDDPMELAVPPMTCRENMGGEQQSIAGEWFGCHQC